VKLVTMFGPSAPKKIEAALSPVEDQPRGSARAGGSRAKLVGGAHRGLKPRLPPHQSPKSDRARAAQAGKFRTFVYHGLRKGEVAAAADY
jgi:hypothetical protein